MINYILVEDFSTLTIFYICVYLLPILPTVIMINYQAATLLSTCPTWLGNIFAALLLLCLLSPCTFVRIDYNYALGDIHSHFFTV